MKKNIKIGFIISCIILVLSFVLVGLSIYYSYSINTYQFGAFSYRQTIFQTSALSRILLSFGKMSFVASLAGIITSSCLLYKEPKKKESHIYEECDECKK